MVRQKNRYITVKVNVKGKQDNFVLAIKQASLQIAIVNVVQEVHGDFGVAAIKAGFTTKYCNENTRIAIIRARHGPHKLVTSALPFLKTIECRNVFVNILHVGATLRHCFKFIQKYQQSNFDKYCINLKTDEEKLSMKRTLMNLDSVLSIQ